MQVTLIFSRLNEAGQALGMVSYEAVQDRADNLTI